MKFGAGEMVCGPISFMVMVVWTPREDVTRLCEHRELSRRVAFPQFITVESVLIGSGRGSLFLVPRRNNPL